MTHHFRASSFARNSTISIPTNAPPSLLEAPVSHSVPTTHMGTTDPALGLEEPSGLLQGLEFKSVPSTPQNGFVMPKVRMYIHTYHINLVTHEKILLCPLQLISAAFEHSMLRVWEIYALENSVFYIAVYGTYKP